MRWLLLMLLGGCADVGTATLGEACETSDDCANSFCVAGEAGSEAQFCSRECRGRVTGEACGDDDRGKCIADSQAWCWLPCESDADCTKVNPDRPTCSNVTLDGITPDFKVCLAAP